MRKLRTQVKAVQMPLKEHLTSRGCQLKSWPVSFEVALSCLGDKLRPPSLETQTAIRMNVTSSLTLVTCMQHTQSSC